MVEAIKEIKLKDYGEKYNGKHNGWAYQLLDDNYEGVYLGVCCKDYLQEQIFTDLTQKPTHVFGQKTEYKGIFDKQEKLILCLYLYYWMDRYDIILEDIENLSINLNSFLNEFEVLMNFEELSVVETVDNKFVITFSKEWIKKPYLLSLFTLLCRIGIYYNGDLENYLKNPFSTENKYLDKCDTYDLNRNSNKILDLVKGNAELTQENWEEFNNENVHDSGIFSNIYKLKYVNQEKKEDNTIQNQA